MPGKRGVLLQYFHWYEKGDDEHPGAMAVLMSNGSGGTKQMNMAGVISTARPAHYRSGYALAIPIQALSHFYIKVSLRGGTLH